MPPRSSTSFCSGSRSITGYGVSGSISVEFAPSSPQTWRANSETATCIPRQMPRYGIASSRATRQARIFPSQPREPKPPGTSTPSTLGELGARLVERHVLGVDPADVDVAAVLDPGVLERLVHREVRVVELHVLADERDLDRLPPLAEPLDQLVPLAEVGRSARRARASRRRAGRAPAPGAPSGRGRRRGRRSPTRRLRVDVGEERDLVADVLRQRLGRAADEHVGWIPMRRSSFTECCVGFVFSSPALAMNGTSVTWR